MKHTLFNILCYIEKNIHLRMNCIVMKNKFIKKNIDRRHLTTILILTAYESRRICMNRQIHKEGRSYEIHTDH